MSVVSWRLRFSAIGSCPKSAGNFFSLGAVSPSCFVFLSIVSLGACNTASKKPDLIFDAGVLTHKQWGQADKECKFEAAKAVVPLKYGDVTGENYRRIYILCAESKGIKFLGTEGELRRRDQ
ncbi:hypothetical protein [Microvirga sp. Mcv34]|uniref:hypothetical protein n=1 Tax=Microvirga sp. Mcv34 TaxID=2926016 RepID=UPI0021C8B4C5|nr:hypothetical protein [Microvirga sp. Mcv34]